MTDDLNVPNDPSELGTSHDDEDLDTARVLLFHFICCSAVTGLLTSRALCAFSKVTAPTLSHEERHHLLDEGFPRIEQVIETFLRPHLRYEDGVGIAEIPPHLSDQMWAAVREAVLPLLNGQERTGDQP